MADALFNGDRERNRNFQPIWPSELQGLAIALFAIVMPESESLLQYALHNTRSGSRHSGVKKAVKGIETM